MDYDSVNTPILDSVLKIVRTFYCFKPPSLWLFVGTVLGNLWKFYLPDNNSIFSYRIKWFSLWQIHYYLQGKNLNVSLRVLKCRLCCELTASYIAALWSRCHTTAMLTQGSRSSEGLHRQALAWAPLWSWFLTGGSSDLSSNSSWGLSLNKVQKVLRLPEHCVYSWTHLPDSFGTSCIWWILVWPHLAV